MKHKSVQNCRFVHHAKFHCIMTNLNRIFKIEFERGGGTGKEPSFVSVDIRTLCFRAAHLYDSLAVSGLNTLK